MNKLFYLLLCLSAPLFSQEKIETTVLGTIPLKADHITHVDNFGTIYYSVGNTFYKMAPTESHTYSNVQLGAITAAHAFNPLKIYLFYKNFNTVVALDNRLSEIYKIDFNTIQPYRNVTHMSTGYDKTIWNFNQDGTV